MASTYIRVTTHSNDIWNKISNSYVPGDGEVCVIEPRVYDNGSLSGATAIRVGDGKTQFNKLELLTNSTIADWDAPEGSPGYIDNKPQMNKDILGPFELNHTIIGWGAIKIAYEKYIDYKKALESTRPQDSDPTTNISTVDTDINLRSSGLLRNIQGFIYAKISAFSAYREELLPFKAEDDEHNENEGILSEKDGIQGKIYYYPMKQENLETGLSRKIESFWGFADGKDGKNSEAAFGMFYLNQDLISVINDGLYMRVAKLEELYNQNSSIESHPVVDISKLDLPGQEQSDNPYQQVTLPCLVIPFVKQHVLRRYFENYLPDWDQNNPQEMSYIKNRPMYKEYGDWVTIERPYLEAIQRGTLLLINVDEKGNIDKTYNEILEAYKTGKKIWCKQGENLYQLVQFDEDNSEPTVQTEQPYTFENYLEEFHPGFMDRSPYELYDWKKEYQNFVKEHNYNTY